ncbi:MAG: hypothetical protein H7Z20_07855 [Bdellovibrio sp.]|nr:hypothetical protein [Methylotenera sp.]
MKTLQKIVIIAISLVCMSALAESWPALPAADFTKGRAATRDDVDEGRAVFVGEANNIMIGSPIDITIPQYAYLNRDGKKLAVIVIQAEQVQNEKIIGAKMLNGQDIAGFMQDFELLGNQTPK